MTDFNDKKLDMMLESLSTYDPQVTFRFDPKEEEKAAPLPFFVRCKGIMTAAGFVLVFALSIFTILRFGTKSPVPVAPTPSSSSAAESIFAEESQDVSQLPTSGTQTGSSAPTQQTTYATQISTDAQGNLIVTVITDVITSDKGPAEPAEETGGSHQSESTKPTGSSAGHPSESGTFVDTEPDTEGSPSEATEEPVLPTVRPLYIHKSYIPPKWEDSEPDPDVDTVFIFRFQSDVLTQNDQLYCRIYDTDGILWGDPDLYSFEHMAEFVMEKNMVKAVYTCDISSDEIYRCNHVLEFYDCYGRVHCIITISTGV
ncbi:MAG: hypothetical protein IJJ15_10545 [Ruminococcus sp.]|nr:hypothetical protein [Ruminococcus sp.]